MNVLRNQTALWLPPSVGNIARDWISLVPRIRRDFGGTKKRIRGATGGRSRKQDCCCDSCESFPGCLTGTELPLAISGFAGDDSFTRDCIFPFTTCHYDVHSTTSFSNINGNYLLDYVSGFTYRLTLADEFDADDIRANGILMWYWSEEYPGSPCNTAPCAGQLQDELEIYISAITATLSCTDGQMRISTVNPLARIVGRFRDCSGGVPGEWSAWSSSGSPVALLCGPFTPTTTVSGCQRGEDMVTTNQHVGVIEDCSHNVSCASPVAVQFTGQINDVI